MKNKEDLIEKYANKIQGELFNIDYNIDYNTKLNLQYNIIEKLISKVIKEAKQEERQFILNVLDGQDIADKEMGVIGGTKAIRLALKNRII
jgi:hypothetical protein